MSNNEKQYLKFWDYASTKVDFYAYAPYVNSNTATTPSFTYDLTTVPVTAKLIVPDFNKVDMVATNSVEKKDYMKDVSFTFKKLASSVRIEFWDDVRGYDVEMIDYALKTTSQEVAAIGNITKPSGTYTYDFTTGKGEFETKPTATSTTINFDIPTDDEVTNMGSYYRIGRYGETGETASASSTVYTAVPTASGNGALTFHVSFKLHSLDTDEVITVKDATVVVSEEYTAWKENTVYTYIFRITKDANGWTDLTDTDSPRGLYPIVFDQIKVEDFSNEKPEYVISATTVGFTTTTDIELATGESADVEIEVKNLDEGSDKVIFTSTIVDVASFEADSKLASIEKTLPATAPYKISTKVYARNAGTSVINAWNNGVKSAGRVVKVPLTINTETANLTAGSTVTLTTNAASSGTVTWTSSNTDVATVAADGKVTVAETATADQTATITATYKDARGETQTKTCTVTVVAAP